MYIVIIVSQRSNDIWESIIKSFEKSFKYTGMYTCYGKRFRI